VPLNWGEDSKLASWVNKRRKHKKTGKLPEALVAKLDALRFDWELPKGRSASFDKISARLQPEIYAADAAWVVKRNELEEYLGHMGHTDVDGKENFKLSRWLYNQKRLWKTGKLSAEKVRLLKQLGVKKLRVNGSI
jgi:hypothetical protein